MKIKNPFFALAVVFALAAPRAGAELYENAALGYSVQLPAGCAQTPALWKGVEIGVSFSSGAVPVLVRAVPASEKYASSPFNEYAEMSAREEIEGDEEFISSEPFVSDSGITGIKALWREARNDAPPPPPTIKVSLRKPKKAELPLHIFYYFQLDSGVSLASAPVKAVMITFACKLDSCPETEAASAAVAASFALKNGPRVIYGENDNGRTSVAALGREIKIELPSNATTGYDWFMDLLCPKCVETISTDYIPPQDTGLAGAGGMRRWVLKPVKAGSYKISIFYYRPWEGKEKSARTYSLTLDVK